VVTKEKRKRQNVSKNFMKLLWNWDFVVNNFVKFYTDINLTTSLQNFVKLLSICYFWYFVVEKFCQTFVKSQKEIANEKSWQNFVKRLWIFFRQFVDDVQLLSVFCERGNIQDVKQFRQSLVITTTNNWGKRCCRDKHKFKLLL